MKSKSVLALRVLLFVVILSIQANGATLYVSPGSPSPAAPFATWETAAHDIQSALDASASGDLILVTNGVYSTGGAVVFGSMANRVAIPEGRTLQSVNGPTVTIIEGSGPAGESAVRCAYVGLNAVLTGFTLTNGATLLGSAFWEEQSGGGVWCESGGVVNRCIITGNSGQYAGGAANGTLNNCLIQGNSAVNVEGVSEAFGGGAHSSTLNNCTVINNFAGGYAGGCGNCTINNSIVVSNTAGFGDANYTAENIFSFSCSSPLPGGSGNVDSDPLFDGSGLRLSAASPCRDTGDNSSAPVGADLDGNQRIANGTVDMGAFEFSPQAIAVLGTNGTVITNGTATVNTANGTDFGAVSASVGATQTFSITNAGGAPLTISGMAISGANAGDFSVLSFPNSVEAFTRSNLVVRFAPTGLGSRTATLTITNNDPVKSNYVFGIAGQSTNGPATRYVSPNSPSPTAPYISWQTAAHTIQEAVDSALAGDRVIVTNGVYATGGTMVAGPMTNRVVINKAITVESVNGPAATIIQGSGPNGTSAVRCVYLGSNAVLSGFTLTNGATQVSGEEDRDRSGGGVWCWQRGDRDQLHHRLEHRELLRRRLLLGHVA